LFLILLFSSLLSSFCY